MPSTPKPRQPKAQAQARPPLRATMESGALTHRQISMFSAIMRNGNLSLAAQACASSQPTLSRELARLEQLLGFALFDRVRGRLRPTVRAMALLQEVERSFIGLEHIAARAIELRTYAGSSLQVACLPALAQALLPSALVHLEQVFPGLPLSVHPMESPWLEQALGEQRFDCGLSETSQPPPGVALHPLLEMNEVAVLPAAHPLAAKSRLGASDFEGQRFISLAPSDPYRQAIDQHFAQAGVRRQLTLETASAAAVCAHVRHGLGVAIVNPLTAMELCGPQLLVRPLSMPLPFRVNVLVPQAAAVHPHRELLLNALARAAADLQRGLTR